MLRQASSAYTAAVIFFSTTAVCAEPLPLNDYLTSMDRTEVSFTGLISYDRGNDAFYFYDDAKNQFSVTVDAGRDARETIESDCSVSFSYSWSDLCLIDGRGTVEIRGSRILLSLETIANLEAP